MKISALFVANLDPEPEPNEAALAGRAAETRSSLAQRQAGPAEPAVGELVAAGVARAQLLPALRPAAAALRPAAAAGAPNSAIRRVALGFLQLEQLQDGFGVTAETVEGVAARLQQRHGGVFPRSPARLLREPEQLTKDADERLERLSASHETGPLGLASPHA